MGAIPGGWWNKPMTIIAEQSSYLGELEFLPVANYIALVVLTGAAMLGLPALLGPNRKIPGKGSPYECGVPLIGEARQRFSIRFYLVAVVLAEMLVFIGILFTGYIYAWRRGGLDWD